MLRQGLQAVNKIDMARKTAKADAYQLSTQVGFNLRRAHQRHVAIFARHIADLTPTQFAVLARLYEYEALSQNRLGRLTAMDSATVKGVVERLASKGLVSARPDANDQRLRVVELTIAGRSAYEAAEAQALDARSETLAPITAEEAQVFETILAKLVN